jgi:hypothetical protein
MRLIWLPLGVLLGGCASDSFADYMDDDVPAGMCEDTEGEACETGGQGETCDATWECGGDLVCAANFNGDIGSFECQAACVPTMDEASWCIDDASCCDDAASCGPRGYCMIEPDVTSGIDTSGDDATSEGSESSTDDGTGTGSDTSTGTETGTGTDTSTGGSSG